MVNFKNPQAFFGMVHHILSIVIPFYPYLEVFVVGMCHILCFIERFNKRNTTTMICYHNWISRNRTVRKPYFYLPRS